MSHQSSLNQSPTSVRGGLQIGVALLAIVWADPVASATSRPDVLRVAVQHVPAEPDATNIRVYTPESFDIFLAGQLAEQLGRNLELVELPSGEASDALDRGEIDLALSRTSPEESLHPAVRAISTGYRSGAAVAMRSDTDILDWTSLAGRTVCVSAANTAGQKIASAYGAKARIEAAPARALMLVRTGVCDAAIHDAVLLDRLFTERGWDKFSATLPAVIETDLSAIVRNDDDQFSRSIEVALAKEAGSERWAELATRWARNVAFEVYLEQDAPDCH